ncbi:sensor histidine kinase [Lentzea sp. NPDC058436]|uniref:sensor histidine kinase n=1 Tax=Lentzea sp. NPDC058436 TaxID=3346499 RepID=UPI003648C0B9
MSSGTIGARFTVLYAVVFLLSGAGLLGLTFLLSGGRVSDVAPPPGLGSEQQLVLQLQAQLEQVHAQQQRQLLAGSLVALVVMAVVSLLVGRLLARRVLRPLRTITSATRRISAESLDRRLAVTGPADEVKGLADTIDELLERLEVSFVAQRRFVANASHELRTPLATMRASADVAAAKPGQAASTVALADRLRVQLDRVDHLLDGFLVLARAQHGGIADAAPVDLRDLVDVAVRELSAEMAAKELTVEVDVPAGTDTHGSPALLARLVGNLVDNAVRHNETGGWIGISAAAGEEVTLVVETGGPVFDQREVDRLAQPFERLGGERVGSSGLGLSIVAAVATAHGGRLGLLARPEGGLRVSIVLAAVKTPVPA